MFVRLVALAALLFAPYQAPAPAKPAAQEETLPDAREIINRHIKAIGGAQAVMAHKSMHATGTLSVPASGISGPIEIFGAKEPDRVLVKTSVQGIGDILEGFDGSHAWSMSPMTGPMLKVGKELDQAKLDADFYSELRDPKKYPQVKTIEKVPFEGRPCYKVQLSRIDGSVDFDLYDAATGLRAGSITTRESPMGTITVTSVTSDYKKFGDMMMASAMSQKVMGVEQKISVSTVEFDKVDGTVFDPPAPIKALIK